MPALYSTTSSKKRKAEVALFVEKRVKPLRSVPTPDRTIKIPKVADAQEMYKPQEESTHENIQQRKLKRPSGRTRPNALNQSRPQLDSTDPLIEGSPDFVLRMEAWAEQTEEAERGLQQSNTHKSARMEPLIRSSDDDLDMNDVDAESDYVYDTYIRHPVSPNTTLDPTAAVGHLVISEEDEELWQTYIDDDADDKEFDTDDEDSNGESSYPPSPSNNPMLPESHQFMKITLYTAEDYYGADYPEDEVDDDDEYDRSVYKYQNGASEDEEWDLKGNDDGAWSDEDGKVRNFSGGRTPNEDKMID
jgi:hypothetical protein